MFRVLQLKTVLYNIFKQNFFEKWDLILIDEIFMTFGLDTVGFSLNFDYGGHSLSTKIRIAIPIGLNPGVAHGDIRHSTFYFQLPNRTVFVSKHPANLPPTVF